MLRRLTGRVARCVVLVIGVAATVVAALSDGPTVAIGAAIVAALVLLIQFFSAGPQAVPFTPKDWQPAAGGLEIRIPWPQHFRLYPNAEVWQQTDVGTFKQVMCGVRTEGHTVVVSIAESPMAGRFAGEVRIS